MTCHINHCHLRKLLKPLYQNILCKAAQFKKLYLICPLAPQINVKNRQVGSRSLDDSRPFHISRQAAHRCINLFINLNKRIINISSMPEPKTNNSISITSLTGHILQMGNLHKLIAHLPDNTILYLAYRLAWTTNLHSNLRDINIRHQ